MPVKRGNRKRRGMTKGFDRSAQQGRPVRSDNVMGANAGENKKSAALTLAKHAKFVFNTVAHIACTFHAIPMKYENGFCALITGKLHKFLHYSVLFFFFARIVNLVYVCLWLIFEEFNTTNLLSFTLLLLYLFAAGVGCCNILISRETVQLVNAWRQVLEILGEARGRPVDMYEDLMLSVKVTGAGGPVVLGPLIVCGLSLVYPELPVSMGHQMKQLLPEMPYIWAQFVCLPLEFIAALIGCLAGSFGVCVFVIGIDLLSVFGQFMRRLNLNTPAQHRQVSSMFLFFKVYNALFNTWYKFAVPQALFGASGTIVVCLYITFRHAHLPTIIYLFYPYLAVLVFCIQFGLFYDILVVIKANEETVGRLGSRHTKCFGRMSVEDRAIGLSFAKAMKPAVFSIGNFTEFNIDVMVGLWDEILNQLMFLLTL